MSLFKFNPFRTSEELIPAQLRSDKLIAFVRVLLRPVKWLSSLFLDDYCKGSNAPTYNNATTYTMYDRVKWYDKGLYELRVSSSVGVHPTGDTLSKTNWLKVLDCWIGADERVRWNSQRIVFEYAINKWFDVTSAPYIYLGTIPLGATNVTVEINIPTAVWTALGSTNTARDNVVIQFAKRYTPSGYIISVLPY